MRPHAYFYGPLLFKCLHRDSGGAANVITLGAVDAHILQQLQRFFIFHALRNRLFAERMCDLVHGFHHRLVNRAMGHAFNKRAVDFQYIDRQVFQVGKR